MGDVETPGFVSEVSPPSASALLPAPERERLSAPAPAACVEGDSGFTAQVSGRLDTDDECGATVRRGLPFH
ncbi:hypothetical protein [Kitasatospora sp. NPDC057500]|uniref:hypothetical protein n=1 Tax=Kitasatospora sp. NPDC057500 TaxID=3346151 RepID=UPI003680F823